MMLAPSMSICPKQKWDDHALVKQWESESIALARLCERGMLLRATNQFAGKHKDPVWQKMHSEANRFLLCST